jgi:hypothetical protein
MLELVHSNSIQFNSQLYLESIHSIHITQAKNKNITRATQSVAYPLA